MRLPTIPDAATTAPKKHDRRPEYGVKNRGRPKKGGGGGKGTWGKPGDELEPAVMDKGMLCWCVLHMPTLQRTCPVSHIHTYTRAHTHR